MNVCRTNTYTRRAPPVPTIYTGHLSHSETFPNVGQTPIVRPDRGSIRWRDGHTVSICPTMQRAALGKLVPFMTHPRELEHALKNYLSIILGFSELLLQETAPDDPRREDFAEIHKAATAA